MGILEDDSSMGGFERQSQSLMEHSLSMTEKDQEPNLVLYSMIKELDHLIESKTPQVANMLDTDPASSSFDTESKHFSTQAHQDY